MPNKENEAMSALAKMEELLEKHLGEPIVIFTKEEAEALKRVAARERGWQALGLIGGSIKSFLVWLGIVVGAIAAFKAGFLDWLRGAL